MVAVSEIRRKVVIEGEARGVREASAAVSELTRSHENLSRVVAMQARVMELEQRERERSSDSMRRTAESSRVLEHSLSISASGMKILAEHSNIIEKALKAAGFAAGNAGLAGGLTRGTGAVLGLVGAFGALSVALRAASVGFTAMQGGASIFEKGSQLLEKYKDLHREFDKTDLKNLTSMQVDLIPQDQVRRAVELGARLQDAKFTLDQFFKVQMDLTKPALDLQAIWVKIVETMAAGVTHAQQIAEARAQQEKKGEIISFRPGGIPLKVTPPLELSPDEARAASLQRVGGALASRNIANPNAPLGGGFNAAWGAINHDLTEMERNLGRVETKTKEVAKATSEARTAWDRAVDSLSKHIATTEADARAVGQGVEAQARLRAEAQLMEAGLRAGMTPEVIKASEAYKTLTQRAGEAAVALERARIRDRIGFERDTMFLPDSERQIASQLRGLYPDINAGLASTEAAQMRVNQRMMEMRDIGMDFARGFGSDMLNSLRNGEKASQAFTNAMMNGLNRIADKLMQMAMENLFLKAFGGGSGSGAGAGGFLSLFGGGGSDGGAYVFGGQAVPFGGASSAYMMGGTAVPVFHRGGMVGLNGEMRWVHPSYFDNAPRAHTGARINWAAGERPIIAQTGERILSRSQNAEYERGGRRNQVIINNYGAQIEHRQNDNGDEEITVRALVRDELASPRTNPIFRAKNGISPRQVRRA